MSQDAVNDRYVFAVRPQQGENWWDVNREMELLTPYAQFKKELGKRRSSNIMEAVWICYDPKSSAVISGRSEKEIQKDLSENLLKSIPHDWKDPLLKKVIKAYKQDCLTFAEKEMVHWERDLLERRIYYRELPWETDRKEKDDMMKTQDDLWDSYLKIKKEVDKERTEELHGKASKSIIEGFG